MTPWLRGLAWRAAMLAATPVGWLIDRQYRDLKCTVRDCPGPDGCEWRCGR